MRCLVSVAELAPSELVPHLRCRHLPGSATRGASRGVRPRLGPSPEWLDVCLVRHLGHERGAARAR